MIIIPFGHDHLVVTRLPFVSIGLIVSCVAIFFATSSRMDRDSIAEGSAKQELDQFYNDHPYLDLPSTVIAEMPPRLQKIYQTQHDWVTWYNQSPGGAAAFVDSWEKSSPSRPEDSTNLEEMMAALTPQSGSAPDLDSFRMKLVLGPEQKVAFLKRLSALDEQQIAAEQEALDALCETYDQVKSASLLRRFAYIPADPTGIGLIGHLFLHAGVFHLFFNMLFLWLAGVKLEDIWTRPIYLLIYLAGGAVGAMIHAKTHSGSVLPLIGASGAVSCLMGAFAFRLHRAEIQFVYAFWFLRWTPKVGTFKARALYAVPVWFLGELFSAVVFDSGRIAYWSHLGGFLTGVVIAASFKLTQFEKRVLGRVPDVHEDPDKAPLVAFQGASSPSPAAASSSSTGARLNLREIEVSGIFSAVLKGRIFKGMQVDIVSDEIRSIAAGRVDRIHSHGAQPYFSSGQIPEVPALLLILSRAPIEGRRAKVASGFVIDSKKVPYRQVLRSVYPTERENFLAFTKMLIRLFLRAEYIPGMGKVAENNLPVYDDFSQFVRHVQQAVIKQNLTEE